MQTTRGADADALIVIGIVCGENRGTGGSQNQNGRHVSSYSVALEQLLRIDVS